jgi:hypothetical protein
VIGRFQPESFPRLGDETIAVSITLHSKGSGLNLAVRGDYVAVRTGDVITAVGQFGLAQTPSMTTFERLTRRAVAKVRRARNARRPMPEQVTAPCQGSRRALPADSPDLRLELTCDDDPLAYLRRVPGSGSSATRWSSAQPLSSCRRTRARTPSARCGG